MIKSIEPYSFTKGTLRKNVYSRLIKPTTQVYLGNVGLLTIIPSSLLPLSWQRHTQQMSFWSGSLEHEMKYQRNLITLISFTHFPYHHYLEQYQHTLLQFFVNLGY